MSAASHREPSWRSTPPRTGSRSPRWRSTSRRSSSTTAVAGGRRLRGQPRTLLASNRRGDTVRLFMRHVGMPAPLVSLMRLTPAWGKLKRVAHTLPYDGEIMGDTELGRPLPEGAGRHEGQDARDRRRKSPAFFHNGTSRLADLLPNAEHRVLAGQTHMVKAKVLAPCSSTSSPPGVRQPTTAPSSWSPTASATRSRDPTGRRLRRVAREQQGCRVPASRRVCR